MFHSRIQHICLLLQPNLEWSTLWDLPTSWKSLLQKNYRAVLHHTDLHHISLIPWALTKMQEGCKIWYQSRVVNGNQYSNFFWTLLLKLHKFHSLLMLFSVDSAHKISKSHLFVGRAKLNSQLIFSQQLVLPHLSIESRMAVGSWISNNTELF